MRSNEVRTLVTAGLVAAAAAWPAVLCALIDTFTSPLQRAMTGAICGEGPGAIEFLGHCPACWAGAVAFLTAAALVHAAPTALRRA